MTSTNLPRSPCLPMQPRVSPRVPTHAHLDRPEPPRAPTAALRALPALTGELPYCLAGTMHHSAIQSRQPLGTLAAYRGHRAIPCDSLCDGMGSARECSLERFKGIGVAIGMQLQGYRSGIPDRLQGIGSRHSVWSPGSSGEDSSIALVVRVSSLYT